MMGKHTDDSRLLASPSCRVLGCFENGMNEDEDDEGDPSWSSHREIAQDNGIEF